MVSILNVLSKAHVLKAWYSRWVWPGSSIFGRQALAGLLGHWRYVFFDTFLILSFVCWPWSLFYYICLHDVLPHHKPQITRPTDCKLTQNCKSNKPFLFYNLVVQNILLWWHKTNNEVSNHKSQGATPSCLALSLVDCLSFQNFLYL